MQRLWYHEGCVGEPLTRRDDYHLVPVVEIECIAVLRRLPVFAPRVSSTAETTGPVELSQASGKGKADTPDRIYERPFRRAIFPTSPWRIGTSPDRAGLAAGMDRRSAAWAMEYDWVGRSFPAGSQ